MWLLFFELVGPMLIAFTLGSLIAWVMLTIALPRRPDVTARRRMEAGEF